MPNNKIRNNKIHPAKILVISGATASGKSSLAFDLACKYNGAIINADALQIYRELPILSAQPSIQDQQMVEHFLYGIFSAQQKLSVGLWLELLEKEVHKILALNKMPIIVGGTGMYISKLLDGIANIPAIDEIYRQQAQNLYNDIGHCEFQKIYGNDKIIDKQKLLRRAEILMQTGNNIEYFQQQKPRKILEDYEIIHFNLCLKREILYQNINHRFLQMLKNGALEEVKNFLVNHQNHHEIIMDYMIAKTLGFQEIVAFLQNKISQDLMIEKATQKTRNYAKRQLTWFRHQFTNINFVDNRQDVEHFLQTKLV